MVADRFLGDLDLTDEERSQLRIMCQYFQVIHPFPFALPIFSHITLFTPPIHSHLAHSHHPVNQFNISSHLNHSCYITHFASHCLFHLIFTSHISLDLRQVYLSTRRSFTRNCTETTTSLQLHTSNLSSHSKVLTPSLLTTL